MLINANQISLATLTPIVQNITSGTAFSGNFGAYVDGGGFMGNNVVWTTGGAQQVSGVKTFTDSPRVPYSGSTGSAPSARWVNDQIAYSSGWANGTFATNTALINTGSSLYTLLVNASGALTGAGSSNVKVTGSAAISSPNFTGDGSVTVSYDGIYVHISGTAGGGSAAVGDWHPVYTSGEQIITGNKIFEIDTNGLPPPEGFKGTTSFKTDALFSGRAVVVNPPTGVDDAINLGFLSGVSGVLAGAGGGGSPNSVTTTGNEVIGGFKQFTGSPFVPAPTQPSGVANLLWVSGVSGVLSSQGGSTTNNYYVTGTGIVAAYSSGTVTNTFNVTSGTIYPSTSGTVTNNFNAGVTYNINQPTGNFVNMSFYFDEYNLVTGLNLLEAFVSRDFTFTGYALGLVNSGTQGTSLSGSLYQRTTANTKAPFLNFSLNSGVLFSAAGGFSQTISGMNRVGIDIYRVPTGMTGFSVGVFGVGY